MKCLLFCVIVTFIEYYRTYIYRNFLLPICYGLFCLLFVMVFLLAICYGRFREPSWNTVPVVNASILCCKHC